MKSSLSTVDALKRIWPYARPDLRLFVWALFLTPIVMVTSLAQPYIVKIAIDDHLTADSSSGLTQVALIFLAAVIARYLVEGGYAITLTIAGQRTILRLRAGIYRHLSSLSASFFDREPAGVLLTRATSDVEALGNALTAGMVAIILDLLMIVGVLGVMLSLNWELTLLLLVTAPPLIWVLAFCRERLRYYYGISRDSLASMNGWLAENIAGVEAIQLNNAEPQTEEEFRKRNSTYRNACITSNGYDALMYSFVDGVSMLCVALMLWYGSGGEASTGVSAGLLVAFIDYIDRLFRPLREFAGKISIIQRATIALDRIFSLLEKGEQITDGSEVLDATEGEIIIKDLRFAYGTGPEILHGIDLEIKAGQVVALIGATGSGKSTLARLLTRTYDGYTGSIKVDGQELRDLTPKSVRHRVTAVPQDVHLFPDSVRFNIGLERSTEPELIAAADASYASGVIEALPDGWDHQLRGNNGALSAGEGQLLTFARTMAANPEVVILDEATASVDSITEALIQGATERLFEKKTVVVIAHRLSTISKADCIVVMEQGRIIERGDHETLIRQNGKYAKLIREGLEV